MDGLTKAEIDAAFSPGQDDCILTSRLLSGESAVMSRDKAAPVLQAKKLISWKRPAADIFSSCARAHLRD